MHGTEQAIENLDFSDQKTARHWRKALSLWEERVKDEIHLNNLNKDIKRGPTDEPEFF